MMLRMLLFVLLAAWIAACGGAATFPDALYGTWTKDSGDISQLTFSEGGRVDIVLQDGAECAGSYQLTNFSENEATLRSGYIDCQPLMDGYATNDMRLESGNLTMQGVWGGDYTR